MGQLSYEIKHKRAYEGGRADSRDMRAFAARNNMSAQLPFGRFVAHDLGTGTSEIATRLPTSASDKILGVSLNSAEHNPTAPDGSRTYGVLPNDMYTVISGGGVYVIAEQAVTPSDPVYVRYTANGTGKDPGQVRKDPDGVAEVHTITPTAADTTRYALSAEVSDRVFVFDVTSGGSATATTIANAFRTAMAADADFSALITASGTATLILTGPAGFPFKVRNIGVGVLADVVTTPAAPKAVATPTVRFSESVDAGEPVALELNLP